MTLTCLLTCRNELGESPLWHQQEQALYWVDAIKPTLNRFDPKNGAYQVWPMPALIGSIGIRAQGGLVAAMGNGFVFINTETGKLNHVVDILTDQDDVHLNDGKCGPLGRFWAGTVSHCSGKGYGKLFCLDVNGNVTVQANDIFLSNGLAWSPCRRYFYFTDTLRHCIYRYRFNRDTGILSEKEVLIRLDKKAGHLDGLTVDCDGYLWSAVWDGYKLIRYTPDGRIEREIALPIRRPTSCIFGGKDMKTLFITSASRDVNEPKPLDDSLAGALFALECDVAGIPEPQYLG